jgi:hypothetical protein
MRTIKTAYSALVHLLDILHMIYCCFREKHKNVLWLASVILVASLCMSLLEIRLLYNNVHTGNWFTNICVLTHLEHITVHGKKMEHCLFKQQMILNLSCSTFIYSLSHVQNATIPCRSQELLPVLSVTYFFLPLFFTGSTWWRSGWGTAL